MALLMNTNGRFMNFLNILLRGERRRQKLNRLPDLPASVSKGRDILLQGTIIYGDDFRIEQGYICLRDGVIREMGQERVEADYSGIICPRLVNAHVHLGDSAFKDPPFLPLSQLVGPGGLKARLLEETPRRVLVEGMRRSLRQMAASGTFAFADFREGGEPGVLMLEEALADMPLLPKILGRPASSEKPAPPKGCWGLGLSSTRDHDPHFVEAAVAAARKAGQRVAVHAGEAGRGDIQDALRLRPDVLVHMGRADERELLEAADAGIAVAVCPRSNMITAAALPDVRRMLSLGLVVGVGTDNVMLNSPDMLEEMHFLARALLHDDRQVFKMCTLNGAKMLGLEGRLGFIREGMEARLMVIDGRSDNLWGCRSPLAAVVRRAGASDIMAIF
jgi:cytosine/adenosine deaminase-related metal-dependent hydrolase